MSPIIGVLKGGMSSERKVSLKSGAAVADALRKRGHTVVAVDVLEGSPIQGERDPLVDRMWTMQRSFMYRDMATVGVDIISWPADTTLDQAMTLVPDRRHR